MMLGKHGARLSISKNIKFDPCLQHSLAIGIKTITIKERNNAGH